MNEPEIIKHTNDQLVSQCYRELISVACNSELMGTLLHTYAFTSPNFSTSRIGGQFGKYTSSTVSSI